MTSASPAFQPDRGLGGFQLAADAGFQTETPAAVADLLVVVTLDAVTSGPRRLVRGGVRRAWTTPLRWTADADLLVVVSLDAVTSGPRDDEDALFAVLLAAVSRGELADRWRALVEADDEEVVMLAASERLALDAWDASIARDDAEVVELLRGGREPVT